MTKPISPVQKMVLDYMHVFYRENDQLPPQQVIADHFGWKDQSNAQWHIAKLKEKGFVEPNAVGKLRFKREGAQP